MRTRSPKTLPGAAAALLLALLVSPAAAPAQRTGVALTAPATPHADARVSPNGLWVVSRIPQALSVVRTDGTGERILLTSTSIGDFLWAPDSGGVFFVDGTRIRFASVVTSTRRLVVDLPNALLIRLTDVDANQVLYGARLEAGSTNRTAYAFSVPGTGANPQVNDLASSLDLISDVRIDLSQQYVTYSVSANVPFAPLEIFRIDANGQNPVSVTGMPIGFNIGNVDFVDLGDTIQFSGNLPALSATSQIWRAPVGGSVVPLTDLQVAHIDARVGESLVWTVVRSEDDGFRGNGPAVMPVEGGGLIHLDEPGRLYGYRGGPDIDRNAQRVVFAARQAFLQEAERVYQLTLDREIRVYPRAEIGGSVTFELPVQGNETGAIVASPFLAAMPANLPGFEGPFVLDQPILTIAVGNTGPTVGTQIQIPNDPGFVGIKLWFQGLRTRPGQRAFTRHGSVVVF